MAQATMNIRMDADDSCVCVCKDGREGAPDSF